MVCPNCGTHVPDDAVRCPACRAQIDATMSMGRLEGTFCPSCGALVTEDLQTCPKCGMPIEQVGVGAPDAPPVNERPAIRTEEAPSLESAIPSIPEPGEVSLQDFVHESASRHILLTVILSLFVVGGATLIITHPWNPDANDVSATVEADTSSVGFPGELQTLSAQDTPPGQTYDEQAVDKNTYDTLLSAYASYRTIHNELEESDTLVRQLAGTGNVDAIDAGYEGFYEVSVKLDELLLEVGQTDVTTGTYEQDKNNIVALGGWLSDWRDALDSAWSLCSSYPEAPAEEVLEDLYALEEGGKNVARSQFEEQFDQWRPTAPETGE